MVENTLRNSARGIKELIRTKFGFECFRISKYETLLADWEKWYRGFDSKFHWVEVDCGNNKKMRYKMKRLCLAKYICELRADLLFNEKVIIKVNSHQEELNEILKENKFHLKFNRGIELSEAYGGYAVVDSETSNGDILLDYLPAQYHFPISEDNGEITEMIFASIIQKQGKQYLYLNAHLLDDDDNYVIHNQYYPVVSGIITQSELSSEETLKLFDVEMEIQTNSPIRRFHMIRPNIQNNLLEESALGISRFANSIEILKVLDAIFDSFYNEFVTGRKRIMVGMQAMSVNNKGQGMWDFDLFESVFTSMTLPDEEKALIKEIDFKLRIGEHIEGFNTGFNLLSMQCGFGLDFLSWEVQKGMKTATEVISENSDLFRSLKKDDIIITDAITDLVISIFDRKSWGEIKRTDIEIIYDDSIIEDKRAEQQFKLTEATSGLLSPVRYIMETRGVDEEEAKKYLPDFAVNDDDEGDEDDI